MNPSVHTMSQEPSGLSHPASMTDVTHVAPAMPFSNLFIGYVFKCVCMVKGGLPPCRSPESP